MLDANHIHDIPELTASVARAAFPKGNIAMKIRDELGPIFEDRQFEELYPRLGQPAESPGRLALVTVVQYLENLTDRQAAEAVRSRIDWKYLLGLELTNAGFHYSVLSEFRQRLLAGNREELLLTRILECCAARQLLGGKVKQRTDSTYVLANIRIMNRIEIVAAAMQRALNDLATVTPTWLQPRILSEWGKRYGRKLETSQLSQAKQKALVQAIGADGRYLLTAIDQPTTPLEARALPSVAILRRIWWQQFYQDEETITWREKQVHGLPPSSEMVASPDELEARYAKKGSTSWTGYKVHLTETCQEGHPHLITHVETTIAPRPDMMLTAKIQQDLLARNLAPETHLCDGAYVDVELLASAAEHNIDLVGPVHQDSSWQAREATGYDLSQFTIDWEKMTATCPEGETTQRWKKRTNRYGKPDFRFEFRFQTCHSCPAREKCTRSAKAGRQLTVYPPAQHELLQEARRRQQTTAFQKLYAQRAGIEGTMSQAVARADIRHARYRGLSKTHLQNLATAAAINLQRAATWLMGVRPESTRTSAFAALVVPL
jgi:transposase